MGNKIVVKNVVRNFPIPDRLPAIKDVRELVLVEYEMTVGKKFYDVLDGGSLRIVTDDGGSNNSATSTIDAEMAAAGYPALKAAKIGQTTTGWAAYMVAPVGSKTLKLRYKRLAAKVIGSATEIPEKEIDVPLAK